MKSFEGLTPKEIARRKKQSREQSKRMAKKRKAGLRRYWAERRQIRKEKEKEEARLKKLAQKENNKKRYRRKKKRGPKIDWNLRKKKKLIKQRKAEERAAKRNRPYLYKIYLTRNGKRVFTIGQYRTVSEAYEAFNAEKEKSKRVVFPRELRAHGQLLPSIDECILVEKNDNGPTMLRNEYGKLVEQRTDLEGWEIIDKFRNNVEETFWVWGYDSRSDRKTFTWVYDNLLICGGFNLYEYRRVFTFRNKLLVRYDDTSLEFVVCKGESDAIRLYNELQTRAKKDGVKQLIFLGDKSEYSKETEKLISEIMEMTGWSKKKVSMRNTAYYSTKPLKNE